MSVLNIDGVDIPINSATFSSEEAGGITRSVKGTLFDNRLLSVRNVAYTTPALDIDLARNYYNYLLGKGELFEFSSNNNFWHIGNKGNRIDAIAGVVAQTTSAGFGDHTRALFVPADGTARISKLLAPQYTIIVQISTTTVNQGNWSTAIRTSSGGAQTVKFQNSLYSVEGVSRRAVTNRLTISGNRLFLNGKDTTTTPGNGTSIYYSDLVILDEDIFLSTTTHQTLLGVGNQLGNSLIPSYMGKYPTLKIAEIDKSYLGRIDSSSLKLNYVFGNDDHRDRTMATVSFTLLEDTE